MGSGEKLVLKKVTTGQEGSSSFVAFLCLSPLPRRAMAKDQGYAGKLSFFPFRTLVM